MRPPGEIREALWRGFESGPATTRELAMRTGVGVSAARMTLDNMRRAELVAVVDEVRLPGVKRPVPVYDRQAAAERPGLDWSLVTCWAQFPQAA